MPPKLYKVSWSNIHVERKVVFCVSMCGEHYCVDCFVGQWYLWCWLVVTIKSACGYFYVTACCGGTVVIGLCWIVVLIVFFEARSYFYRILCPPVNTLSARPTH